ncbi:MAG TPA: hypothetical protein VIF15_09220, partial [Polyangiaceae bacterium]
MSATLFQCGGSGDTSLLGPGDDGGSEGGSSSGGGSGSGSGSSSGSSSSGGSSSGGSSSGGSSGGSSSGGSSGGSGGSSGGSSGSSSGSGSGGDGGAGDGGDGGSTPKTHFRVAELMPDPAAYDFCWSQAAGTWNGPVMKGFGIAAGVQYQQVSEYIPIDVAATTVRLVSPNAADCNTSLGDAQLAPPGPDAIYLVALFVQGNLGSQVKVFPDERHISSSSHTKLRAIHAAFAGVGTGGNITENVDFYLSGGVTSASLFDNVPFGGTA